MIRNGEIRPFTLYVSLRIGMEPSLIASSNSPALILFVGQNNPTAIYERSDITTGAPTEMAKPCPSESVLELRVTLSTAKVAIPTIHESIAAHAPHRRNAGNMPSN